MSQTIKKTSPQHHSQSQRWQLPLHLVLVGPFVLLIAGTVGLTSWLSWRSGQQAVEEVANRYSSELTERIQQHLESYLDTPEQINRINQNAINLGELNLTDLPNVERYLWRQIQSFETINYIMVGTERGDYVAIKRTINQQLQLEVANDATGNDLRSYETDRQGQRTQQLTNTPSYDPRIRPWYNAATKAKKPAWSNVYQVFNDQTLSITHGVPLYNQQNSLLGVVGVELSLPGINEFLENLRVGQSGQTFIVERSGDLIADSVSDVLMRKGNGKSERIKATEVNTPLIRSAAQYLIDRFGGFSKIQSKQSIKFNFAGALHILEVTPFRDEYGIDWLIVVVVPEADFMEQIHQQQLISALLCLLALSGAIALGILTTRWITKPIRRLSWASQAITSGELNQTVPRSGILELDVSSQAFNQMATQLQQSFTKLEQTNADLEQRVDERTIALQRRAETDSLLSKISRAFLDQDADVAIAFTLKEIGEFTGSDRSYIVHYNPQHQQWSMSHDWCAEGIESFLNQFQDVPVKTLPWFWQQLLVDNLLEIPCIADLGPEAALEKALLEQQSTQSLVNVAITHAGQLIGFIGLNTVRIHKVWSAEDIRLLKVIGELIAIAQARQAVGQALQASEAQYRDLVQTANSIIVRWDASGHIRFLNDYGQRFFGYPEPEILGRHVVGTIVPETESSGRDLQQLIQDICEHPDRYLQNENENIRRNGERVWLTWANKPIMDEQGQLVEILSFATDISQRKAAEVELQSAKEAAEVASRAKSEFLANMSHELRTPLNGILGYAQILKRSRNLTSEQSQGLDTIQQSGEHLLMLINDVLDLSKIEARHMEIHLTDFHLPSFLRAITDIFRLRAHQKGITLLYEPLTELPSNVQGDEQRLRQVLFNLLSNAVKFTDQGGVVFKVGVVAADLADESISSAKSIATIRFQVEDSGIGIASEHLEEIFLPFQQVGDRRQMREGTGLGLAISRKLVEMMGGNLSVQSAPNQGSQFWFELEMLQVEGWPQQTAQPPNQVPEVIGYKGRRQKVLVVDEQAENRRVLVKFLSPLGFEIMEAENGQEGVVRASDFEPDVIFMDLVMPVMDGFEATRQLRRSPNFQNTIIIAASASAFEHDQQDSLNVGCNAFLAKPIRYKQLLATLEQLLSLEWVYEETGETGGDGEMGENDLLTSSSAHLSSLTSVGQLSTEVLDELLNLARMGAVLEIQERVTQLEQSDSQLAPFAAQVRQLADSFQIRQLQEFLHRYKTRSSAD